LDRALGASGAAHGQAGGRVGHPSRPPALLRARRGDRLPEVLARGRGVLAVCGAGAEDRARRRAVARLALELVVGARLELLHGGQAAALLHPDLTLLGGHAWKGSLRRRSICSPAMGLAEQMERTNRVMIAFDLVLGTTTLLAPSQTLRV